MAKDSINKEIKRATESVGAVKTETYLVKKWQAGWILGFAALMLVGMLIQVLVKNVNIRMVGVALVLVGVVAIIVVYLIVRTKGPLNFVTYFYRTKTGDAVTVQAIGKKRIILSVGGKFIEYDRRAVKKAESLYKPEIPWNFFEDSDFTTVETIANKDRKFTGKRVYGDTEQAVILSVRSGVIDYAEVDGIRMRYYEVNNLRGRLILPATLYDAAEKAGFGLKNAEFLTRGN